MDFPCGALMPASSQNPKVPTVRSDRVRAARAGLPASVVYALAGVRRCCPWKPGSQSKVEADLSRHRARRNVVRSAEGRKEIVERLFIGQIDDRKRSAPLVPVAVEDIVVSHARSNRLRGAMRGGLWSSFSVPGAGILTAWNRTAMPGTDPVADRRGRRRMHAARSRARPGTADPA